MAILRIRLVPNEGRIGIPLEKLAGITSDTKEFLAMVATDLDLPGDEWIAVNFENGSVVFDCERLALDSESWERGKRGLRAILGNETIEDPSISVRVATRLKYSEIARRIDPDERIRIAVYENGTVDSSSWYELTREQSQEIEEANHRRAQYYGEIQGYVHSFYKEARKPKLVVRDLATRALVDCFFKPEMYEAVVDTMTEPKAVIFVEGIVNEDLGSGCIESIEVSDFHLAPEFDLAFFESFVGTKPDLTGDVSSERFIRELRDEDDARGE
jgi:hypothetical protein